MVISINEHEQRKANESAIAIARYAMTQMPKKARVKIEDFLPYPNLGKNKNNESGLMPKTKALLKRLIKAKVLPARVEAAAMRDTGVFNG